MYPNTTRSCRVLFQGLSFLLSKFLLFESLARVQLRDWKTLGRVQCRAHYKTQTGDEYLLWRPGVFLICEGSGFQY